MKFWEKYQQVFPPMYKEDEGFGYTWRVFLGRVKHLLVVIGVLAIIFVILLLFGALL